MYSGTVLRYYIDQTFLATFRSDLDLGVVWLVECMATGLASFFVVMSDWWPAIHPDM